MRRLLLVLTFMVGSGAGFADQPGPHPQSSVVTEFRASGEALETVLPRLGGATGLRLRPAAALKSQRVTVFARNLRASAALAELLSPGKDQKVVWRRDGDIWTLQPNGARQRLQKELQQQDLEWHRAFLESEIAWLREAPDAERRGPVAVVRIALAGILDSLERDGRARLLAGEPMVVRVGRAPEELRNHLRTFIHQTSGGTAGSDQQVDDYQLVLLATRDSTNARSNAVILSFVKPSGSVAIRIGTLRSPQAGIPIIAQRSFRLPPPDPQDPSPRISFQLTTEAPPSGTLRLDLDQVLKRLAIGTQYSVVADGYLRPTLEFPARLEVKDYPIRQLMNAVAEAWKVDWRFQAGDERTILVRSRNWWLDDQADVPEAELERLQAALPTNRPLELKALLDVAELTRPQIYRLIETGRLPAAEGVVIPLWHDDTGVKPVFQFFKRLPDALKAQALSQHGLSIGAAPKDLVQTWLARTLIAQVGAVDPESWQDLRLWIRGGVTPPRGAAVPGFEVRIGREGSASGWREYVAPRARPIRMAPAG